MSKRCETWCVIGGGMLGMVTALRLAEEGKNVTLLEAAPTNGGLASAWKVGDISWDMFYHVILGHDTRTLALLNEIGLGNAVEWKKTATGFYANGKLAPLNNAADYLRLPGLGLFAKLRLAYTLVMAARIADGRPLEKQPVKDWLIGWSGKAAYEKLWQPLLRAKLGNNAEKASAAFIWATMRRLYLARKGGAKTEELGFVNGGYRRINMALSARLKAVGVNIRNGTPVSSVTTASDGFQVVTPAGTLTFDRVVSTLPTVRTQLICPSLDKVTADRLDSVIYQGVICASVVLKRPLEGYYLTYLTDTDLPLTGIVEMSSLTGTDRFAGKTLVYLPRYATQNDAYWDLNDEALETRFIAALRDVYPDILEDDIEAVRIARVRHVMAVPTLNYSACVPPVETNLDGFYVVCSAQITDGTLNVDATLGVVEQALPKLLRGSKVADVESAA